MRGRLYSSCASSTWSLPSAVWACAAKMSRITAVRSTTRISSVSSSTRCCTGVSSSSQTTTSASDLVASACSSSSLPGPRYVRGCGRARCCTIRPTPATAAVRSSSSISSSSASPSKPGRPDGHDHRALGLGVADDAETSLRSSRREGLQASGSADSQASASRSSGWVSARRTKPSPDGPYADARARPRRRTLEDALRERRATPRRSGRQPHVHARRAAARPRARPRRALADQVAAPAVDGGSGAAVSRIRVEQRGSRRAAARRTCPRRRSSSAAGGCRPSRRCRRRTRSASRAG